MAALGHDVGRGTGPLCGSVGHIALSDPTGGPSLPGLVLEQEIRSPGRGLARFSRSDATPGVYEAFTEARGQGLLRRERRLGRLGPVLEGLSLLSRLFVG